MSLLLYATSFGFGKRENTKHQLQHLLNNASRRGWHIINIKPQRSLKVGQNKRKLGSPDVSVPRPHHKPAKPSLEGLVGFEGC